MSLYGISDNILKNLLMTSFSYPEVKSVILYGSRARGDYQDISDIDLAIDAPNMSSREYSKLWNDLDDLPIIYTLDVVHLQALQNAQLLQAIREDGIALKIKAPN